MDKVDSPSNLSTITSKITTFADAAKKSNVELTTSTEKVEKQAASVIKSLDSYSLKNNGFENFSATIGEAEVSVKSLRDSLQTVKSTDDLNELKQQFEALKVAFNADEIEKSIGDFGNTSLKIETLKNNFQGLGLTETEVAEKMQSVTTALGKLNDAIAGKKSGEGTNEDIISANKELLSSIEQVSTAYKNLKMNRSLTYNMTRQTKLSDDIQVWLAKNTAASKEAKEALQQYLNLMNSGRQSNAVLDNIESQFKRIKTESTVLGKIGKSLTDQWKQGVAEFTSWLSASKAVMAVINKTREAFNELKEVDTYITEISKANDTLTDEQLKSIASSSFGIAGKYGKTSTDYLAAVQEMSRAGYKDAEGLSELSVAAQGAGDMTADLANQYIIATDKAFAFEGSVEKLNEVLDGANYITNNNAVNMTELAEGMSIVGSQAASSGMEVDETTAALGTMIAVTQQSGSRMANAFKGILMNIQQVTGKIKFSPKFIAPYVQKCA